MKKTILSSSLILLALVSTAQNFKSFGSSAQGASINFQIDPTEEGIEGNPLLYDAWAKGTIRYNQDRYKVDIDEMNINLATKEVVFNRNDRTYIVPNKLDINRVEFEKDTFILVDYRSEYYFFKVESTGNYSLLELNTSEFVKGTPSKGYIAGTNDRYVRDSKFFIQKPNKELVEINPRNGKKIFKIIDTKGDELKAYVKDKDLKLNDLAALKDVLNLL